MKKSKCIFTYAQMQKSISGYGFSYSFRDFLKVTLLVFVGLGMAGYLYELRFEYIIVILLAALVTLPMIVTAQYRYLYEQKRFSDAVSYMEQMMYMFKKRPQVLYALRESMSVLEGTARECCRQAIEYLENGRYENHLYRESLLGMEMNYGNERMYRLHRFLIQVESEGGEYQHSLNLMLDDLKNWVQRVYEFQKERKKIKNNITISIFASLLICLFTTKIFPREYSISHSVIYQSMTTIMVILLLVLYAFVQSKMNGVWLIDEKKNISSIQRDYQIAVGGCQTVSTKRKILLSLLVIASVTYGFVGKNYKIIIASLAGAYVLCTQPRRRYQSAKKRTIRELEKAFPEWMREMTVRLQRQAVPSAIEDSKEMAPAVLQVPLANLSREFETDLVTMKPYSNFLKEFDLPEITSAMKLLYVLNTAGRDEVVSQLNALVERNMKLQEKGERLRMQDQNTVSGFAVALPMLISFIKLVTDMILLVIQFLDRFSTIV